MFPFPAFSTPLPEDGVSGSATRPDPLPSPQKRPSRPPLGGVGSTPNRAQRVRRKRSGATLDASVRSTVRASHPLRARARRNCGYGASETSGLISPSDTPNGVGPEMLKPGRIGILDDGGYWYWDGITVYHADPERDWTDVAISGTAATDAANNDLGPRTVLIASRRSDFNSHMAKNVYPWYMLDSKGKFYRRPTNTLQAPGYWASEELGPDFKEGSVIRTGNRQGRNKYLYDLARVEVVYPPKEKRVLEDVAAKAFHEGAYTNFYFYPYSSGEALLASMGASVPAGTGSSGGGTSAGGSSYVPTGGGATTGGGGATTSGGSGGGGRKRDDVVKPGTAPKVRDQSRQTVKSAQDTQIRPGAGGKNKWILPVGLGLAALGTVVGAVYWRKRKAQ